MEKAIKRGDTAMRRYGEHGGNELSSRALRLGDLSLAAVKGFVFLHAFRAPCLALETALAPSSFE